MWLCFIEIYICSKKPSVKHDKKAIILSSLLLTACGASDQSNTGVGFGNSIGGGTVQAVSAPTPQSIIPVTRASTALTPLPPRGPVPQALASMRPRIIKRIQSQEPVPVYATRANLSEADLRTLSPATKAAIDAAPPSGWLTSHERGTYRVGLMLGSVIRVRVNGVDFAQMLGGTFVPILKDKEFALIAYRSGCRWNGLGDVRIANNPYLPGNLGHKLSLWHVGLSC